MQRAVESFGDQLPWGLRQRLEFIEFRLFWDGYLNRSDITGRFSVSIPQASNDLGVYKELAPGNMEYDAREKRYLATGSFEPRLTKPNAERYLAQIKAISDGVITIEDTLITALPDVDVMPLPSRRVEAHVLRSLFVAARSQRSLNVEYQSMNAARPDPIWRKITPHAFSSDGLRWHVRAFCHLEHRFKDFIISRCLRIGEFGEPQGNPSDDVDWNSFLEVILIPNPHLSEAQRRTIQLDYGMNDGTAVIRVRHALLYYFDKRLRLDVAEQQDRPKETPVIVANREEYDRILRAVAY